MKFSEEALRSFRIGKLISVISFLMGLGIVFYKFGVLVGLAVLYLFCSILILLEAVVNLLKSESESK